MFFDITGEVKLYPYRTALVSDFFLVIPRDALKKFEQKLVDAVHARPDNHTVYGIQHNDSTVYVWFHDMYVHFGWSVEERSY